MTQCIETVAIVPAYNEHRTVGDVAEGCLFAVQIDAVIVVDDGSTDGTAKAAYDALASETEKPFEVIRHDTNMGKSEAILTGYNKAQELAGTALKTLVFLDSDLSPLSSRYTAENKKLWGRTSDFLEQIPELPFAEVLAGHINELVEPVKGGDEVMSIGLLNRNPVIDRLRLALGWGALSGCRAINAAMFDSFLDECVSSGTKLHGWEIEAALNTYTRKRLDENGRKLNRSIGKHLWDDVVNIGSRVKAGSITQGIKRMLKAQGGAARAFVKYAVVFR